MRPQFPTLLLPLLSQQADFEAVVSSLIGHGGGQRTTSFEAPDEAGIYALLSQREDEHGNLADGSIQFAVDWQRGLLLLQDAQLELRPLVRGGDVQAWLVEPTGHVGLVRESHGGHCALVELLPTFEIAA